MKTKQLIVMMFALAALAGCKENRYISNPGDVDMSGSSKPIQTVETDDPAVVLEAVEKLKADGKTVLTADEAIAVCKGMQSGVESSERYYIYGYISSLGTKGDNGGWLSASYGNGFYYIKSSATSQSSFYCYQIMGKDGAKYLSEDDAYVGQWVLISCKITNYSGTYETTGKGDAFVVCATEKVIETAGDGTEANPYSMEDLYALSGQVVGKNVWFKGVMVGCIGENGLEYENYTVKTNFAVSSALTSSANAALVRVELPSALKGVKKENQAALAPIYHPENVGKEILVKGTIEKSDMLVVSEFEEIIFEGMVYTQTESPKAK